MPDLFEIRGSFYRHHFEKIGSSLPLERLLITSDFAFKQSDLLKSLVQEDDCLSGLNKRDYQKRVNRLSLDMPRHVFAKGLRDIRHRTLLRLFLRELADKATIKDTTREWTLFADLAIQRTVSYCFKILQDKYGKPQDKVGCPVYFYALAMGKLGGRELNFSSDIDLIFTYTKEGKTDGKSTISNQEFFTKLVQAFMHLMQYVTEDGMVFRIDLRLRPNGESGPLVINTAAMETYYQEQGRDWERYAMVKARLIEFDKNSPTQWFSKLIKPFVYRRYVDFSVIESLRSMKGMIEKENTLKTNEEDIKRGRGGIREVEFIVQSFQLIKGGRVSALQETNTMRALEEVEKAGLLAETEHLEKAYWFLRKLENVLQIRADQQTHSLPEDSVIQRQVCLAMGYSDWGQLMDKVNHHKKSIHNIFLKILSKPDIYQDEHRLEANQLASIWQGHVEPMLAENVLASFNYANPKKCFQMLTSFRQSPRCNRLSQVARIRLDKFMILLLDELKQVNTTDLVLLHVIRLLESIVNRSVYLALLIENPAVLQELLQWFQESPFVTSMLVTQPFLLEVLIDQNQDWKPSSKAQLRNLLSKRLKHCEDEERINEALREFKLTCWLSAARSELYHRFDSQRIAKFLSDVAEVIIQEVLEQACQQLAHRYAEIDGIKNHFAIIAYGKLGAQEMTYESDVDLVSLHSTEERGIPAINRLTQKILHSLTQRTQTGILYSVDTRLRPSGSQGLLVSPVDAFMDYQKNQAWTWEHQALIRARVLCSSNKLKLKFYGMKQQVLNQSRNISQLSAEIIKMRTKISQNKGEDPIKTKDGGLIDLEFLIQFLFLAHRDKTYQEETNTSHITKQLRRHNILNKIEARQLQSALLNFHQALHQKVLASKELAVDNDRERVQSIYRTFLGRVDNST